MVLPNGKRPSPLRRKLYYDESAVQATKQQSGDAYSNGNSQGGKDVAGGHDHTVASASRRRKAAPARCVCVCVCVSGWVDDWIGV